MFRVKKNYTSEGDFQLEHLEYHHNYNGVFDQKIMIIVFDYVLCFRTPESGFLFNLGPLGLKVFN